MFPWSKFYASNHRACKTRFGQATEMSRKVMWSKLQRSSQNNGPKPGIGAMKTSIKPLETSVEPLT